MSTEIDQRVEELTLQKQALEGKIAVLDEQGAREAVQEGLRTAPRHIFFRNNEDIVFDTQEQILWTAKGSNHNHTEQLYPGIQALIASLKNACDNDDQAEIAELREKTDSLVAEKERYGFKGWHIPNWGYYRDVAADAPVKHSNHGSSIKKYCTSGSIYDSAFFFNGRAPSYIGYLENKDSYDFPKTNNVANLLVVNCILLIKDYTVPNLDKYSDTERQQLVQKNNEQKLNDQLDNYLKHGLAPVLDKSSANKSFDILLQVLPPLKQQLAEVEKALQQASEEKEKQRELLSSKFDYRYLLNHLKLDCATIDSSVVKYADATLQWSTVLLSKIAEYEMRQAVLIACSQEATAGLSSKFHPEPNLAEQENQLLADRQQFMRQRFNLDFAHIKTCVAGLKHQGHNLKKQLADINALPDSISKLGAIHHSLRAPFDLLAENTAMQITDKLRQMEFYEDNTALFESLIATEQRWADDFKALKTSKTNTLMQKCQEEGIEPADYQQWLQDWYELRLQLEISLQALLECGIEHRLNQHQHTRAPVLMLIEALEKYKQAIDNYYLNDRAGVHQNLAFAANARIQERLAVETDLYKLSVVFQQGLQTIIFGLADMEQRLFVFHWADKITELSVGNVVDFIKDQQLDQLSQALLNDFTQLRLKNYACFIDDAQHYAREIKEQEKGYNALMFKMRKELANTKLEAA